MSKMVGDDSIDKHYLGRLPSGQPIWGGLNVPDVEKDVDLPDVVQKPAPEFYDYDNDEGPPELSRTSGA